MRHYLALMRLDKPIGTLLLLWPTLWGLWLASNGPPRPLLLGLFITGVILMRSAGCVINDIADQSFDGLVARTRTRPLAAGVLTRRQASIVFALLLAAAASLLIFLNPLTRWLAIACVFLAAGYPFLKRITHLPQLGLGVAFAAGIPMAFAACQNTLPLALLWPFTATFCWIVMYDTLYAMTDRDDDLKAGIRSTAILFGRHDRLVIGLLQLATLAGLAGTGQAFSLDTPYYLSLLPVAGLFLYQQWLIRHRQPDRCFQAFLNNQWVGFAVFAGIMAC